MPDGEGVQDVVADKGYHSNQTMLDLDAIGMRSYIAEPDRGRRNWRGEPGRPRRRLRNRRRMRGARGKRLLRRRGEHLERSFAHLYETGGMRRTHLRGHDNILKRVLVHASAFNLGLLMRHACGRGTPRGLQGRRLALLACLWSFLPGSERLRHPLRMLFQPFALPDHLRAPRSGRRIDFTVTTTCATGLLRVTASASCVTSLSVLAALT